jgi:predicted secreted Zn-dependent protease
MLEAAFNGVPMLKQAQMCLAMCGVAVLAGLAGQAEAKNTTQYSYYAVTGATAPEILKSLHRRGPNVAGVNAYATTYAEYQQKGKLQLNSKSCKINSLDFDLKFTIKLPRHRGSNALTGRTATAWSGFEAFVKKHEETHRSIWLDCAKKHATAAAQIRGTSCSQVEAQAERLWKLTRAACNKRHATFDLAERPRLARQPFIRMALRGH